MWKVLSISNHRSFIRNLKMRGFRKIYLHDCRVHYQIDFDGVSAILEKMGMPKWFYQNRQKRILKNKHKYLEWVCYGKNISGVLIEIYAFERIYPANAKYLCKLNIEKLEEFESAIRKEIRSKRNFDIWWNKENQNKRADAKNLFKKRKERIVSDNKDNSIQRYIEFIRAFVSVQNDQYFYRLNLGENRTEARAVAKMAVELIQLLESSGSRKQTIKDQWEKTRSVRSLKKKYQKCGESIMQQPNWAGRDDIAMNEISKTYGVGIEEIIEFRKSNHSIEEWSIRMAQKEERKLKIKTPDNQ